MGNLVTIIVPCYNQAQFLDECLQSVSDQTYANWECIIVNDGSPDATAIVAKEWLIKDSRFTYVFKENGGLSSARNFGISYANGEYILPLDADDKIGKNYVAIAMQAFEEDNDLKVVYCKAEKFGKESGNCVLPEFTLLNLAQFNIFFCSAFFKKADWELVGGYDENMKFGWEDWEFWIALLKDGGKASCIDSTEFYYRIKNDSMVKQMDGEKITYSSEYLSIKHADFFVQHLGSFMALKREISETKNTELDKLKSEKYVVDVFCKRFFGFTIFGLYKK